MIAYPLRPWRNEFRVVGVHMGRARKLFYDICRWKRFCGTQEFRRRVQLSSRALLPDDRASSERSLSQ
jgi:hypothetical protein